MKRIFALMMSIVCVFCFGSCKAENGVVENESDTIADETKTAASQSAYEEMKKAAKNGEYSKAVEYYKQGAADIADYDVLNWYYYSLAMAEYTEYGCVGYPINLIQYNVSESFEPAKKAMETLKNTCSNLNGVYESDGRYIYIADGKIAVSVGSHLTTAAVFCNAEIAEKDGNLYYADRKSDGTHINIYTIEKDENGKLILLATEYNTADIYSGEYVSVKGEIPELIY